jgi:hypothetical protein
MREAADELGVSVEAIRKRVQRGSIRSDKDPDGRRYVYLDAGRDPQAPVELVDVLRAQVEDLRGRLDKETEANRENRRIIAGLIERVPELEQRPQSGGEAPDRGAVPDEAQAGTQRLPWWRRWFDR